jgi:hypothetical protein|uniref:Scaffolding protein n=1 Tax=Siphoviridae sp. ctUWs1 TaxID=2826352 RepID=A0A8S5QTC1_9CAUD|nr:MAG TPA: hypothetical protein [Siphoviridae sp. ctUWs1]
MADTPTESSDEAATSIEEAAPAPEPQGDGGTEAADQEEVSAAPEEPESVPEEPGNPSELDALKERLGALEAVLANKDEEIKALRDTAAKDSLIRDAGLPSKYAQFLHGDESGWGDQVSTLLELTSKTPARPRDPAVDAQVGSDSEDRETAILRMFGLAE